MHIFPYKLQELQSVPPEGRLLFTADYTDMENFITWVLAFGAKAEVLEPTDIREKIRCIAENTAEIQRPFVP